MHLDGAGSGCGDRAMALRYSKVSVPARLMERLSALVSEHPELGYRSASDAATEAIRRHVEELERRAKHR